MNYYDKKKDNGVLTTYNREDKIFSLKYWLHDLDYYVLDTNYKDFMMGYFCTSNWLSTELYETFYILTRDKNFDLDSNSDISLRIQKALSQFKPNIFKLQKAKRDEIICEFKNNFIKKKPQSYTL